MIPVNRPTTNKTDAMLDSLERVLDSGYLTNFGPFHNDFEQKVESIVGGNVQLCNNATTALIAAISCLSDGIGEIVTPAFTFSATTQAIRLLGHTPIFADSALDSFNVCPHQVEKLISSRTKAIVAVQCYGYTHGAIELFEIARRHGIPLIFDAAHAFTSTVNAEKLFKFADAVVYSFHATKLFNCVEGGAVTVKSQELKSQVKSFINFGMDRDSAITSLGLNGKLSELHAAVGLHNLESLTADILKRKNIAQRYSSMIQTPNVTISSACKDFNFAYYPILFVAESDLIRTQAKLLAEDIHARRYFHPLAIPKNQGGCDMENALRYSKHVLCLPLYPDLKLEQVDRIADIINDV